MHIYIHQYSQSNGNSCNYFTSSTPIIPQRRKIALAIAAVVVVAVVDVVVDVVVYYYTIVVHRIAITDPSSNCSRSLWA